MELSRSAFLRLGASGIATAAGGVLGAGVAFGAPPPPSPQGDDLGFLAFGAVGEGAARTFYVNGAGYAADPGTRLLIARLLPVDGQLLGSLRAMSGKAVGDGLPNPMSTEDAGAALDKLISVPGSPGGR